MRYLFYSLTVIFFLGFSSTPAWAAVIKVDSDFKSVNVGDIFTVEILADTENTVINAVATDVIFPSEFLEYVSAEDGGSVISLWVEPPAFNGLDTVSLSGITLGGFSGQDTELLKLKFKAIKAGQGNIESSNTRLLLHDGLGTLAPLKKQNLHITINNGASEIVVNTVDDERPESFQPEIIQDPDVFDGRYALIFATKDKGSGIDGYEVKEGWFSRYHEAESPHELKDQTLSKKVQVRAIDKAGNIQVETIYPQNWQPPSQHPVVIISILILCVLSFFIFWRFFRLRKLE